jgi:VanZ family protein
VRALSLWVPVAVCMAAIFYVSSLSAPPLPGGMTDKSGHVLGYAVLGLTIVRAIAGGLPRRITPRIAALSILLTVAYGVTDEVHQMFVPGRSAEVLDVVADAAGAAIAVVACWAWGIISRRAGDRSARSSHDL